MTQHQQIVDICTAIGRLAEISMGDIMQENSPEVRLEQINHIINWAGLVKQDLDTQHNIRLDLEDELERLRMLPIREQLLFDIDRGIQNEMKHFNVDIALGAQLLPRIMDIVDTQTQPIIQEIDRLRIHIDSIALQLSEANGQLESLSVHHDNVLESQIVTSSASAFISQGNLRNELDLANERIAELETIISGLELNNTNLNKELTVAKNKNQELVQQIVLSNTKVQEIEKKLIQNSSKGGISNSTNDANIRIINQLKGEKQALNSKINELVDQVIDANSKIEQLEKKKRSTNTSPVREPVDIKSSNPKVKNLQLQLISRQQEIQSLNAELRNANDRIKQLIDELMSANGQIEHFKKRVQVVETVGSLNTKDHQKQEIIANANQRIEQLMVQYSDANNRIAQLETQLQKNHFRKDDLHQRQETKNVQLGTQLLHAQQRIEDLINQLAMSNNRITDLELDIEAMQRESLDKNNAVGYQKKMEALSYELFVSNNKVEEMMKMVANYQNNVIDLELDKEALIFQLNDARNKQDDYLDEIKVERATVNALKEQLIKIKQSYYEAARGSIRGVESEINHREVKESIRKPDVEGEIINLHEPVHLEIPEKSERSQRDHAHRKIFDGKVRGSQASNRKD